MLISKPTQTISDSDKLYINPAIKIITDNHDMNKVICVENIKKNSILIKEYSNINLFGEKVINRDVEFLIKLIESNEQMLYPRNYTQFTSTQMTRDILKIIKNILKTSNLNNKLNKLNKYNNDIIEFYYAKHLFNSFEGFEYGPLYLPHIAKLNHSCNPNTYFEFNKEYGYMTLYAKTNIKKGEEITDSYLLNKNIDNHREYLRNHYMFDYICSCE
jgi:hypothetical protein